MKIVFIAVRLKDGLRVYSSGKMSSIPSVKIKKKKKKSGEYVRGLRTMLRDEEKGGPVQ